MYIALNGALPYDGKTVEKVLELFLIMSILVNPEIIPILSGFHSSIIRTRKRPALVLISDTKLLCKNDYKTISAA